jgi:hypothetical protein
LDSGARPDAGSSDAGAVDAGAPPDAGFDAGFDAGTTDAGAGDAGDSDAGVPDAGIPPDAFADAVISFTPGPGAGYGQDKLPGVVLGPPQGAGDSAGSTDVLSLGQGGVIVLETGFTIIDGPGVDLLVFENPFAGFIETGIVAVSEDGGQWFEFPCAAPIDGGTEGCAGVNPVYSNPSNGISPTDPTVAGGDGFDLAQLGVARANYVRIRDSGVNHSYAPPTGGFDLDAIAVVHGMPR